MKRILFVDDEPSVLQALQRMLHGQRQEWELEFARSGAAALQLLEQQPVDVVVSDMRMPGMDGAKLLSEVMRRYPQTVRIFLSGHTDKEALLSSVGAAHQFLAKPCDPDVLKETIARACALRQLLHSEQLKGLVSQVQSLPSLPHLYVQIQEELQSPNASLQRVGQIIAQDIGMTAKVLQLVNSAFFGIQRRITQPCQAVSLLGLETVNAIVLSVKLFSSFDSALMGRAHLTSLWEHSMATARLAKRIALAEPDGRGLANYAFMGGLLHDAGKLVLATDLATAYGEALALAEAERLADWVAERRALGATHAEVGAYLLGLWGLPDPIVEAVAFHHTPSECAGRAFSALTAVHVANAFDQESRHVADLSPMPYLCEDYVTALGRGARLPAWRELAGAAAEKASAT
jgi:HD-like signal output (HDOD) protein